MVLVLSLAKLKHLRYDDGYSLWRAGGLSGRSKKRNQNNVLLASL